MPIEIDDARAEHLKQRLRGFWFEEFDEELSPFRADRLLEFFTTVVGPQVYNQAVRDARRFVQQRLDDLDVEVHEPEVTL